MTMQAGTQGALAQCRVGITSSRRGVELAALLERRGARVEVAPALAVTPCPEDAALREGDRSGAGAHGDQAGVPPRCAPVTARPRARAFPLRHDPGGGTLRDGAHGEPKLSPRDEDGRLAPCDARGR
jgi:hypothetical protein